MNISIPIANTMEFISATRVSPLISKCNVKVCYVGQEPNRNGTVITKEVATEMGRNLPGSPVVGFYNKEEKDFEGHNREIIVEGGKFTIVDTTRPYGFIPTDATVWFEKFNDDGVEHEYLVTECYLWTSAYPEAQRILENGNNQSMELEKENSNGIWTNDNNSGKRIFIYNEALIEKLCILGENVEPCFEGAQFKNEFSLENSQEFQALKAAVFSLQTELQEILSEGGSQETMEENKNMENQTPQEEFEKKKPEDENTTSENSTKEEKEEKKPSEEEKKKYNLDEVTEYIELNQKFEELQSNYTALEQKKATLEEEVASLREFKVATERQNKQTMIDGFYMLSEEDKKEVIDNIDNYSLDDIEAKLSIICVRNKLNLSDDNDSNEDTPSGMFSFDDTNDGTPDWIKAVEQNI